ncbi:Hsp70 family protein [bacterium]|nr:Hsp70 family protein [candidate division CSSED10-310 bacterium]
MMTGRHDDAILWAVMGISMEYILGLDIGTSHLNAGLFKGERYAPVMFSNQVQSLPAVVAISTNNRLKIAGAAIRQAAINPQQTFYSILRYLGCNLTSNQIQEELTRLPYTLQRTPGGQQYVVMADQRKVHFSQLLCRLVAVLRESADTCFGTAVTKTVIALPQSFSHNRKLAVQKAVESAGLNVMDIIDSTMAIAFAHTFLTRSNDLTGIFDMGAGSLKIGFFQMKGRMRVETIATQTFEEICGDGFDYRITDHLEAFCRQQTKIPEVTDPAFRVRLKIAAESAKKILSNRTSTRISIPYLAHAGRAEPFHMDYVMSRKELESLTTDLVNTTLKQFDRCLDAAELLPSELKTLIVTGRQSAMPLLIGRLTGISRDQSVVHGRPDLVAMGAAMRGADLKGKQFIATQRHLSRLDKLPRGHLFAGRFKLEEPLGHGAFSLLYEVSDRKDDKHYALKILRPAYRRDPNTVHRFITSAEIAKGVDFPNIRRIFAIIDTPEILATCLELLTGWTLEEFLQSGRFYRMGFNDQIKLIMGILQGMIDLRGKNLYHGDLKPDNIWVTRNGQAKLFDFGLARYANGIPIIPTSTTGTPRYMSPEHLFHRSPFGDWSEIYSFGLILYRCFTEQFPRKEREPDKEYLIFDFSSTQALDPQKVKPTLPRYLCDIISTCIRRSRTERYQKFEELLADIENFRREYEAGRA